VASALIDVAADEREIVSVIEDFVLKTRESLFTLANPGLKSLSRETISEIEDLPETLKKISDELGWSKTIKSLNLSSLSVYQMRVERTYDNFYSTPVKSSNRVEYLKSILKKKEEHYLLHYVDGETVFSDKARSILPAGMEIEKRREMMNVTRKADKQHDKFFVALPSSVKTEAEKQDFKERFMKAWMLENVVGEDAVTLLDRAEYTASDIYNKALKTFKGVRKDNTGIRVVTGQLGYDDKDLILLELAEKAKNNINQYEVFVNLVLSKAAGKLLDIISGLENREGKRFIYLPAIEAIDLEEEVREYYRYVREVLVKA
jgi:hypothetical protein